VARLASLLPQFSPEVDAVILRWKGAAARDQVDAARRLCAISPRPLLLLSDRFDLARVAGLDGVQLPENGAAADDVRRAWPAATIGVSRHDSEGARNRSAGADFLLLAPVFRTAGKPDVAPIGVQAFSEIAQSTSQDVIALGGVVAERVAGLLAAGAKGVALRGAVFGDADPVARVRELRAALDSAASTLPDDQFVTRPDRGVRPE